LAKRLTENQKNEIIHSFTNGKTVEVLSKEFNCTNLTISRNLKKKLGEEKYKELINKAKLSKEFITNKYQKIPLINQISKDKEGKRNHEKNINTKYIEEELTSMSPFTEIAPLNYEIENQPQKDLSSIPINEINFPNTAYMIVDKKIELEIKYLKDYPEWQFLSQEELNRKTIEIFDDLKIAKRVCNKEQKVIKVPNTNVFKTVASILLSKGISRIVSSNKLIAL